MAYTLTYSDGVEGWVSFYSFHPDWILGMNNHLYTFYRGDLFRHNTNPVRNNFYGTQYSSTIQSVFNTNPLENKLFKTINIEGDAPWDVLLTTDLQNTGNISAGWFERKEASYYAFIRNGDGTVTSNPAQYPLRSLNGIGASTAIGAPVFGLLSVSFSINPYVEIGSIISINDYIYFMDNPTSPLVPTLFGVVVQIVVDIPNGINTMIVATNIVGVGGNVPTTQTPYIMYIKNSVAESHGVLGHYCVFDLTNSSTSKVELFTLESEVMKSYP